jgi:probable phosphoglycerate mutase
MTELFLIRHGETAWNAVRRLQGHLDIPLNAEGLLQAKALAASLQHEKLHGIISSDLQRAMQTAEEIARLQGLPTCIDRGLRERCFGGFEGQLYSELPLLFPDAYASWRSRDPDFHFPASPEDETYTGESSRQFQERVMTTIACYAQQFNGKKIALVAHGGVLECAYRAANNLPLNSERNVSILNASISRFKWENSQLSLIRWGDIEHLSETALDEHG